MNKLIFKDLTALNDSRLKIVKVDVECDKSINDAYAQVRFRLV